MLNWVLQYCVLSTLIYIYSIPTTNHDTEKDHYTYFANKKVKAQKHLAIPNHTSNEVTELDFLLMQSSLPITIICCLSLMFPGTRVRRHHTHKSKSGNTQLGSCKK